MQCGALQIISVFLFGNKGALKHFELLISSCIACELQGGEKQPRRDDNLSIRAQTGK